MTSECTTVAVIKGQMSKFSGIISKDLSKPKQRLVKEMIYGIQAAKDIKLSSVVRDPVHQDGRPSVPQSR